MTNFIDRIRPVRVPMVALWILCLVPVSALAVTGDEATHEADHALDADIIELPEVHVHGLPLNKDQQVGPVPKATPWPAIPSSLDGKPLDDWMKARLLVSKNAEVTVVVLESAKHRELTIAGIIALNKWTFAPQLKGDDPVDGELTVRIHFRSQ
ncbi:MAG TPA: hypothetical protein DCQ94_02775 [Nitrospira sp.]|nr:hypothetical protein [Nitrospira sp.]